MKKLLFIACLIVSLSSAKAETLRSLYVQDLFGGTNNSLAADKSGHIFSTNIISGGGEVFTWTDDHNANLKKLTNVVAIVDDSGTRQIVMDSSGYMYLEGGTPGSDGQVAYGDILAPVSGLSQLWANDPVDAVYGVVNRRYADAHYGGSGGEVFTWTANHDAAGFTLLNGGVINANQFEAGFTTFTDGEIDCAGGSSFFYLNPDANFGIHNGEGFGSGGENINLVSDNGAVKVSGTALQVSGGIVTPYREVSANYTVNPATDHVINDVSGSGSLTITFPDPMLSPVGQQIVVICSNGDTAVTLLSGTDVVSVIDVQGASATFYNTGTRWLGVINAF